MRLDARTKLLNPKWYEGMMNSGYEGVREIQKRLTNTMGWSATAGAVSTPSSPPLLTPHQDSFSPTAETVLRNWKLWVTNGFGGHASQGNAG